MKVLTYACIVALGMSVAVVTPAAQAQTHSNSHATPVAAAQAAQSSPKLHAAMRSLWQGHIQHTRDYAMAVKAGNKMKAKAAADATVANAKDIANAVAGFYGKAGGDGIMTLLAGHWGAVKAMTDAEHAGDRKASSKAMQDGITNAGAIAKFLATANPNLTENGVNGLLVMHVADHHAQIGQIMTGDKAGEAKTWEHMQAHMNTIADALSDAIAKQFPKKAS